MLDYIKEHQLNIMLILIGVCITTWDEWKALNKEGMDIEIEFSRIRNVISTVTENAGIHIRNVTTLSSDKKEVYVALSGDQCTITNIKIQ